MRADLALLFSAIMIIAVVSLLVRYGGATMGIVREVGDAGASVLGVAVSGNPQFYERARGFTH